MNKILAKMKTVSGLAREFGVRAAYVAQIEFNLTPRSKREAYFFRKHKFITNLLEAKLRSVIDSLGQADWSPEPAARAEERLIWVFWWQGEDAMPDIVTMCCDSIRHRAGARARVILLSKDNLSQHVALPDFVMSKLDAGLITLAHFSDIVRFYLLHRHGGLWLDATVYLSQDIPDQVFAPFFTIRHQPIVAYASLGRWTGFALGGHKGCALFAFVLAAYYEYWERQNLVIDYYLMDYLLNLTDRRLPAAHRIIELNTWRGDGIFELASVLNAAHDPEELAKVLVGSVFHKLSWKAPQRLKTQDGADTNFAVLLRRRAVPK